MNQIKLCHTGYILIWFLIYRKFVFNNFHKNMDKRLVTFATFIRFLYGKFSPVCIMRCIFSLQKNLCHIRKKHTKNMDKRFATLATFIRFLCGKFSSVCIMRCIYGFSFIKILFSIILTKKHG